MKVVSLVSSATEIVCELGLEDYLVGISHECDFPASIRHLPVCSAPNLDPNRSSREIDQSLRSMVERGLSIYRLHDQVISSLAPDWILTQDQCEVCAVSLADVEKALQSSISPGTRVCSLKPHSLADIRADFRRVAAALNAVEQGEALVRRFDARLEKLQQKTQTLKKPRVALVEWLDPLIIAGGWMPEILSIAGGEPVIVTQADAFRKVTWEELTAAKPEYVVLMPCGYPLQKTMAELLTPDYSRRLGELGAKCVAADGNSYFNRPGPRIADSAEILAAICHGLADFNEAYRDAFIRLDGVR